MSDSSNISVGFDISTTDAAAALGVRVYIDNVVVHENPHVAELYSFVHQISDDDGEHTLDIELFKKLPAHTIVDDQGQIVSDAVLVINNIKFDDIDVTNFVSNLAEYHHDFNGTQEPVVDKFYSDLGCNGTVKLKFTTPIYLWLLENM